MSDVNYLYKTQKGKWWKKLLFLVALLFVIFPIVVFFSYAFVSGVPRDFPLNRDFEIKKGMSIKEIGEFLEKEHYIKSAFVFRAYGKYITDFKKEDGSIDSGWYNFKQPLDVFDVYRRLKDGESGVDKVKITFIEGETNHQYAKKIARKFKNITEKSFLEKAKEHEGYLYPDTYNNDFTAYSTEEDIIKVLRKNFDQKNKDILKKIKNSDKSLEKIIIMASLIEKEAGSAPLSVKKMVSGILWNRIRRGMPLQVDAVFSYINKRHIKKTLYSHLKVDSPYNTYKYKGFPPTAICNPTTSSIVAAFSPTKTSYLYYITGKDGKFYYAKTGTGHQQNVLKYRINYKAPEIDLENGILEDNSNVSE
ncbi:hypothetical protein CSB11_02430 [Candidatus Campbellbacteria bacterium]|nr:MAG: hypothetical protein CSB11_02430 [Candidatus Campbellbacteria bacterium]